MANEMDGRTAGRSGSGNLNSSISRGGFVKTMGVGMAAAATGLSMAAKAQTPSGGGTTTVYATGKYPIDVKRVQDAVDRYDTVILSGTFNFGDDRTGRGCVTISREGVILQAAPTGATILGGGATHPLLWDPFVPPISAIYVEAPGVTIRGLTMSGATNEILVTAINPDTQASDKIITIENNTITAIWAAIHLNRIGGWPTVVKNNTVSGQFGIYAEWTGYAHDLPNIVQRSSPLDILDNNVTSTLTPEATAAGVMFGDGIMVAGWFVTVADLLPHVVPPAPDWGDNGPVTIKGNTVTSNQELLPGVNFGDGICIGRSAMGLNHCTVSNNVVKGYGQDGIGMSGYGHDNHVIGNDLSGYTSYSSSISITARDSSVVNNILGKADLIPWFTCGILLYSMNPHPDLGTPMPLPTENNTIENNDYTHTGCQGWRNLDTGNFNILVDTNVNWGGPGCEVRNNYINETASLGLGGAREQIYVGPGNLVYNNRIVGLPANNVLDPGIGQRIKDARSQMLQLYGQLKRA